MFPSYRCFSLPPLPLKSMETCPQVRIKKIEIKYGLKFGLLLTLICGDSGRARGREDGVEWGDQRLSQGSLQGEGGL